MPLFLSMRGVLLVLLLITVSGCGYHVAGSSSQRIDTARTIWIPYFGNESISPTAQTVLRRAFYDEFHALRGLSPAANEGVADLAMKAKIVAYSSRAVSYNALDQAREFSLNLNVELELTKKDQKLLLWKGQIQGSKQYPANTNLALQSNSEEQALDAAARIIAHKFISAVDESY